MIVALIDARTSCHQIRIYSALKANNLIFAQVLFRSNLEKSNTFGTVSRIIKQKIERVLVLKKDLSLSLVEGSGCYGLLGEGLKSYKTYSVSLETRCSDIDILQLLLVAFMAESHNLINYPK